ncbi:hypothetical protein H5410_015653 [Solanum commersonii]|uniref:Uncharacterized protein n=1 Tax=Solanum commersonii TaxID=4109 RepID=A0A9J5ZU39_SOLCO|nr:hypothetical protein H5410_015653 [Solanum commersonii]
MRATSNPHIFCSKKTKNNFVSSFPSAIAGPRYKFLSFLDSSSAALLATQLIMRNDRDIW